TTGSMVWRWDGIGGVDPVVVNGYVLELVGSNLFAIDGRTGKQVWMGLANDANFAVAEGYVILTTGGQVTALATGGTINPPSPTAADEAVSHQIDVTHSGSQPQDTLTPPLTQMWARDLGAPVSYPLIVGGRVFVAAQPPWPVPGQLYAFDRVTGSMLWGPVSLAPLPPGTAQQALLAA